MQTLDQRPLTLNDIALLTHVQRPVVTMWRSRFASRLHPFPAPNRVVDGQEVFDCEQVVEWLETTGAGNNTEARDDAIAFTLTAAEVITDEVSFAGLSALLCLRAAFGPLPMDRDDLLDHAEAFDSDDEVLFGELEALGDRLLPLARYAELLVAAAYDPVEPLDELVRRRAATGRRRPLGSLALEFVARAALAVADEAGWDDPTLVVLAVEDVELIIEAARLSDGGDPLRAAVRVRASEGSASATRLARRWLYAHAITRVEIVDEGDGDFALPDRSICVLRLPTADDDRVRTMTEFSSVCLNLSTRNRALVLGPAATLTDSLPQPGRPGRPDQQGREISPAGQIRRDVLKTDLVRAVVRLPRGLLPEAPRSRAALWCLGPPPSTITPSRPMTFCADVNRTLPTDGSDDLLTDIVAALQGPAVARLHGMSSGRFRPTTDLLTAEGDLVTAAASTASVGGVQLMTDLQDLLGRGRAALPALNPPELLPTTNPTAVQRLTLGEAVHQRKIIMIAGTRIPHDQPTANGPVPVVRCAAQVHHRAQLTGLSMVEIALNFPHVQLTEPGDVVLSGTGRPSAQVDRSGGSVVAYPARVLRCHRPHAVEPDELKRLADRGEHPADLAPQTFTPEAIAADINGQPSDAGSWQAWPLTVVPTHQIGPVERHLNAVAARRSQLRSMLDDLDASIPAITRAVAAQICIVTENATKTSSERIRS